MFDHRAIKLSLRKKAGPGPSIPTISHKMLRDPDLDYVVGLAVADTYLNSTAVNRDGGWETVKTGIGRAKNLLRQASPSNIHLSPGDRTEHDDLSREGKIGEIRETLEVFPFPLLKDGPLVNGVDPDYFMEELLNNILNPKNAWLLQLLNSAW